MIETDRLRKMRPIVNYYRLIIRQVGTPATEVASSFHGLLQAQEAHPEFAWRLDCFNLKHTIDYKRGPEWEVVPDVDEIQKILGVSKDDIATKLVLYERGHHFAFWSLQIRTEKVIVRHVNDTDFVAWLGLEKGFSGPIARVKNELPKPGTKKANQPHETTKPATTTDGSPSKKRNADHNSDQDPEPPKKKRLTQAELTGYITGLRKGLTDWQLNKTTFYVSVIPTRGLAVPIKLKLCPDVDKFVSSVLVAWDLEGKEAEVSGIAVQFGWLGEEWGHLVKKEDPGSFEKMLEIIEQAPAWKSLKKQVCAVEVRIIIK